MHISVNMSKSTQNEKLDEEKYNFGNSMKSKYVELISTKNYEKLTTKEIKKLKIIDYMINNREYAALKYIVKNHNITYRIDIGGYNGKDNYAWSPIPKYMDMFADDKLLKIIEKNIICTNLFNELLFGVCDYSLMMLITAIRKDNVGYCKRNLDEVIDDGNHTREECYDYFKLIAVTNNSKKCIEYFASP